MGSTKCKPVEMTPHNEFIIEFLKFWRQLDEDAKDRVEAELRRLLKEEHGSWEVGRAWQAHHRTSKNACPRRSNAGR
jgi:hypothetical protein